MRLEDLTAGMTITGVSASGPVTVVSVSTIGADAVQLVYRDSVAGLQERMLLRSDEAALAEVATASHRPYDAPGATFRLVAEAQRIRLAGLFDPMLALASSSIQALPHQISAVYGELLPRTPLRFLLADDPGAGKTIMAGLYVKELLLRGDLARCLIVAPGGLVEQWQDELHDKVDLDFEILTSAMADESASSTVFERHPLLIARMDQLARNEELLELLQESEWDLVVVDEAHRMAAHYFGGEVRTTRRYELGELLGSITRHLLLMTATPHAGKEDDFQLFLALLDPDRYAGRFQPGTKATDTSGLMRRMIKEDLQTFDGDPLFPQRVAETAEYELSPDEHALYEEVTAYVREEMGRADRLEKGRGNTVGFALTVLQRRLASSPEAIWRSLQRRRTRLQSRRDDLAKGPPTAPLPASSSALRITERALDELDDDLDELDAEELEELETEVVDAATAARTVEELDKEIAVLVRLEAQAASVRAAGNDRKWIELRSIINDRAMVAGREGDPRKLIVFTEHKDTLTYVARQIRNLLGADEAVVEIHGAVRRSERRARTEEFTKNPRCRVMVATDAAGEGLNLQRAHLMVNYDLPWNPNRIEQRFGRIHRIGQREICRLWNLVAVDTREGQVFQRLLGKVEEQRKAYGGRVFDVLGESFRRPLRELLMDAIRKGDDPAEQLKIEREIDHDVNNSLVELLQTDALAREVLSPVELAEVRRRMDEARARRIQPHYIELFFRHAFTQLGGRVTRRERGRFEIANVPAPLRRRDSRSARRAPVPTRYERVAFDPQHVTPDGQVTADLVAPGHPLFDAVVDATLEQHVALLARGAVLVDERADEAITEPLLLVAVAEEVVDGRGLTVGKRFSHVWVDAEGRTSDAGSAPHLDFAPPKPEDVITPSRFTWLGTSETAAVQAVVEERLPAYAAEIRERVGADVERTRDAVRRRLTAEINRLHAEAASAAENERAGRKVRVRAATLEQRADDLDARLVARMRELDLAAALTLRPPQVVSVALVVPRAVVGGDGETERPEPPARVVETREVERRAVDLVLAAERALGRVPVEQSRNNPGFDIASTELDGHVVHVEVKGRIDGAEDFAITYNEILFAKNTAPRYRLALVRVSPDGPGHDELRYLDDPFATTSLGDFNATVVRGSWAKEWARGRAPF